MTDYSLVVLQLKKEKADTNKSLLLFHRNRFQNFYFVTFTWVTKLNQYFYFYQIVFFYTSIRSFTDRMWQLLPPLFISVPHPCASARTRGPFLLPRWHWSIVWLHLTQVEQRWNQLFKILLILPLLLVLGACHRWTQLTTKVLFRPTWQVKASGNNWCKVHN